MADGNGNGRMTEADVEALRTRHGKILVYEVDGRDVVFRRPTRAEFMRLVDQLADDKLQRSTIMHAFARACAILPEPAAMDAVFDEAPGQIVQATSDLQQLAGVGTAAVKKGV